MNKKPLNTKHYDSNTLNIDVGNNIDVVIPLWLFSAWSYISKVDMITPRG